MPATACRYLDLNALLALAHLRFSTRQMIDGTFGGRHPSHHQGGSGEFVDYREYSAGEDLRRLDWKVLGRTGRPYVRQYQDEANLLCIPCIDTSGSMGFTGFGGGVSQSMGGRRAGRRDVHSKLEFLQYFSAALAYLITTQRDQVGLAVVGGQLNTYIEPGSTGAHLARCCEAIEGLTAAGPSGLAQGLEELFVRSRQRGVLLLASDFLVDDLERVFAAVRLFRHRRWEVVVLHIIHPDEERLPEGMAYRFVGMEEDGLADCAPADIAALYEERFGAHTATVRALSLAGGCEYRRISTGDGYLAALGGFLVERTG